MLTRRNIIVVVGLRADRAEQNLVAVRGRQHDALGAVHPARPADIFDDHLLAENIAQSIRQNAADYIGRTAGSERHDHGNGPRWPLVSLRDLHRP